MLQIQIRGEKFIIQVFSGASADMKTILCQQTLPKDDLFQNIMVSSSNLDQNDTELTAWSSTKSRSAPAAERVTRRARGWTNAAPFYKQGSALSDTEIDDVLRYSGDYALPQFHCCSHTVRETNSLRRTSRSWSAGYDTRRPQAESALSRGP